MISFTLSSFKCNYLKISHPSCTDTEDSDTCFQVHPVLPVRPSTLIFQPEKQSCSKINHFSLNIKKYTASLFYKVLTSQKCNQCAMLLGQKSIWGNICNKDCRKFCHYLHTFIYFQALKNLIQLWNSNKDISMKPGRFQPLHYTSCMPLMLMFITIL